MTTIAANAGPERMSKWLLIGGVALALLTGVLVFIAVSSTGGDDESSSTSVTDADGPSEVLVAKDNIDAGTKLTADMFRVATFAEADLVQQSVSDPQAIIGETATTDLLKGQQLSRVHLAAATDDERAEALAFKIPEGHRAFSVGVVEETAIGGNLVPGDRVDIVVRLEVTETDQPRDRKFIKVHTVLQNVLVVAREQTDVERVVTLEGDEAAAEAEANAENNVPSGEAFQQRPEDVDPDSGLTTVSVALTPQQMQEVYAWDKAGELALGLRRFGDESTAPLEDTIIEVSLQP
jgi:Flp pilus assembly protein CpaB